jgi:hypothetical protein
MDYNVRAPTLEDVKELQAKVLSCMEGGAK